MKNITLKMYDMEVAGNSFHTKGYIFKKEEIYRKFEEDSAAGRREGTFDITQCVYNGKAGGGKREKKSKCNRGYRWKENGIYS